MVIQLLHVVTVQVKMFRISVVRVNTYLFACAMQSRYMLGICTVVHLFRLVLPYSFNSVCMNYVLDIAGLLIGLPCSQVWENFLYVHIYTFNIMAIFMYNLDNLCQLAKLSLHSHIDFPFGSWSPWIPDCSLPVSGVTPVNQSRTRSRECNMSSDCTPCPVEVETRRGLHVKLQYALQWSIHVVMLRCCGICRCPSELE